MFAEGHLSVIGNSEEFRVCIEPYGLTVQGEGGNPPRLMGVSTKEDLDAESVIFHLSLQSFMASSAPWGLLSVAARSVSCTQIATSSANMLT